MACALAADDASAGRCENLATPSGKLNGPAEHFRVTGFSNTSIYATQIYVGDGKRDYVPVERRVAVNGDKYAPSMRTV